MFIGSIFFEFIGAIARWIYLRTKAEFTEQGTLKFSEVYNGRRKSDDQEKVEHSFRNIILGMVITVLILSGLISLTR
jgi:hypothetical protein